MLRKNIVVKKSYTDKTGNEKIIWNTVGKLHMMDDGKMYVELFMHPEAKFYVFDEKNNELPN